MLNVLRKRKEISNKKYRDIRSTANAVPIIAFDYSGVFEVQPGEYSMSMRVKDINYSLSRQEDQEDIFLQFAKTINYFTSDVALQVTLNNENLEVGSIKNTIEMDTNRNDGLDYYRKEFNEMLLSNANEGKNKIRKEIYITVKSKCKNINEAKIKLNKVMAEVTGNLKRIGSATSVLVLEERGEVLHDFFRNGYEGEFEFNRKTDLSIVDAIAPTNLEFKSDYFRMGNKYCRGLFLANIPSFLSDKLTADIMEFDDNIMLSIHMKGQDSDKTMKMLNNKLTSLKAEEIKAEDTAIKNNRVKAYINPHLREAMEEVEKFKDMVTNKNQKVFFTTYVLVHMADSKTKLDEDTKTLQSIASKNLCKLRTLKFQQEKALRTVIPLGVNELESVDKCLTTESATILSLPFNSVEYLQNNGFYYGKNSLTGNMIMIDKRKLRNQNGFTLGSPGSGKSFSVKREELNIALVNTDADIFILDPEDEYGDFNKELNGEVTEISLNSNTHINPLDMEYDIEEDSLKNKCDFMLTICNMILGGKDGLSPAATTILDRVCHKIFKNYIASNYDERYQPTLLDFLRGLQEEEEEEAKTLAVGLEIYCEGSLDLFSHKTNVNTKNRIQVYNLQKLGNGLKPLALVICLETIWQKIIKNRKLGRQTIVICDEAHLFFGEGNEYSARYMEKLYKRARKYFAWITSISQNITGMLADPIAASLIANSEFLQILNQSPQDKIALANLLGLSDLQLSYVSNSNPGEGLLIVGQSNIIPFQDKFPKHLKIYRYMTTDPEEIKKFKEEDRLKAEKLKEENKELERAADNKIKEDFYITMPKSVAQKIKEQEKINKEQINNVVDIRINVENFEYEENTSDKLEIGEIEQEENIKFDNKNEIATTSDCYIEEIEIVKDEENTNDNFGIVEIEQEENIKSDNKNEIVTTSDCNMNESESVEDEKEKLRKQKELREAEEKIREAEKLEEKILAELKALGKNIDIDEKIYCIEDNEIYDSMEDLQEKWGLKSKNIISDVCNKKVKRMKRKDGFTDYVQETLKDRRDGKKKHIIWYAEYLNKKDA